MKKSIDPRRIDFESAFNASPVACILLLPNPEFTIIAVSEAYSQAAMRTREDLIGLPLFEAFPDNPGDPAADGVAKLSASLKRVLEYRHADKMAIQKYDIPRPEALGGGFEKRWWNPVNSPVLNDQGEIEAIIHQVEDVTEIVLLKKTVFEQNQLFEELQMSELALKSSQGKLESAVRARDELISICSHELRTPVTSMRLQTQMTKRNLAKGDPLALSPERMKKLVEQSDRQLDRLTRLIEEMLDFSRVQAGKLKLHIENLNLVDVVCEVVERLEPQAQVAQCTLILDFKPIIQGFWDRIRLEQIITNLLVNAIRYAPGKPIRIQADHDDSVATFKVEDEGVGIHSEDLERIFKPYERAVSVSSMSGLGLGLYITRQIVESHHGQIQVRSELGKGACFTVELPLNAQEAVIA